VLTELDPHVDAEHAGDEPGDLLELGAAQHSPSGFCEHGGLAFALLGGFRPASHARGERADDECRDEEDGEGEPVRSVAQLERVRRRQEEPVEGKHARHRDSRRECEPPEHRDRQHSADVEHAEAEDRHVRLERRHRRSDDCDGGGARKNTG
jgi:hypothetical protein